MTSAHEQVLEKARNVVAGYAASRAHWNPASSLSTLLRQMQREYEDRFLYELVQNAYDAHPPDADGEIAILLAECEEDHGVLYVANRGNPFTHENFEAICELAQSNKTPDESIGNKGVGFKSVLQVCEWPEIYSRSHVGSPGFDGYCFTFARPDAYDVLAGGDRDLAQAMRQDVAPYFLPVPLSIPVPTVIDFAARGFATVLRLPLKSAAAAEVAPRPRGSRAWLSGSHQRSGARPAYCAVTGRSRPSGSLASRCSREQRDVRTMTDEADKPDGPEIVIGLVGAVGTDLQMVSDAVGAALDEVAYSTKVVRLSALLNELDWSRDLPDKPLDEHIARHMDAGDELRETWNRGDALALISLSDIADRREALSGDAQVPAERQAYVLR